LRGLFINRCYREQYIKIMETKEFFEEIQSESVLPSDAGYAFIWLLGYEETSPDLGFRELKIIRDWLTEYVDTEKHSKELDKMLIKQDKI